jgi:hypothetical protein
MDDKAKRKNPNSGEIWDLIVDGSRPLGEAQLRFGDTVAYGTIWPDRATRDWMNRHPEPFPTRAKLDPPQLKIEINNLPYSKRRNEKREEQAELARSVLDKYWNQEGVDKDDQITVASYELAMGTLQNEDPKWLGARLKEQAAKLKVA